MEFKERGYRELTAGGITVYIDFPLFRLAWGGWKRTAGYYKCKKDFLVEAYSFRSRETFLASSFRVATSNLACLCGLYYLSVVAVALEGMAVMLTALGSFQIGRPVSMR